VPRWTFSSLAGMHLRPRESIPTGEPNEQFARVHGASNSKLTTNGHDVWLDDGKLQAGQDWDLEVRRAISTTDAVVV
jgi:hypothetical protein